MSEIVDIEDIMPQMPETQGFLEIIYGVPICLDFCNAILPSWIIALIVIICLITVGKVLQSVALDVALIYLDFGPRWIVALYLKICLIYVGAIGYTGYWIRQLLLGSPTSSK